MGLRIPDLLDAILEATASEASAKARIASLRAALEDEARRRYAEEGAAPTWTAPKLGKVRFDAPGDPTPVIGEPVSFTAWVAARHPTEVVRTLTVTGDDVDAALQALDFVGVTADLTESVRPSWASPYVEGLRLEDHDGTYAAFDPDTGEHVAGITGRADTGKLVVSLDRDRRTLALEDARAEVDVRLKAAGAGDDLEQLDARRRELEGMPHEVLTAYAGRLDVGGNGTKAALAERIARTEARTGHRELIVASALEGGAGEQEPQGTRDEAGTETSEQPQAIRADAPPHETEEEATAEALKAPSVKAILGIGSREQLRRYAKAHDVPAHGTKADLAIRLSACAHTVDTITQWVETHATQEPTP